MKIYLTLLLVLSIFICSNATPKDELDLALNEILTSRSLMGLQLELTKSKQILYHGNFGKKDNSKPIENSTMFRVASLSKNFAASGIMKLVEQKKITLNQSVSSILGFPFKNPFFPEVEITLEMILSHQSSLIQCEPYYSNFLTDTYNAAKNGTEIPLLKNIISEGGKYYNECLFSKTKAPGTHWQYVNLNFGIAGAVIEKVSGIRFDIFMRDNILKQISMNLPEQATFNAANIKNSSNLGTIYVGNKGVWQPSYDYYPDGKINAFNLQGYAIGSNGVIFGPQGGLRASVSHLSNYMIMLANDGVTKQGIRVLQKQSVHQMLKPRYQYHGTTAGPENDFHQYGFGLYTTSYRKNDIILSHEVLRGHLGAAYGLISGYFFWKEFTLTYQINGALNGYGYGTGTIYQRERLMIHQAVESYLSKLSVSAEEM